MGSIQIHTIRCIIVHLYLPNGNAVTYSIYKFGDILDFMWYITIAPPTNKHPGTFSDIDFYRSSIVTGDYKKKSSDKRLGKML